MRIALALVCFTLSIAHADVRTSKSAKVTIDFPTDWKVSDDPKDAAIRGVSKDNAVLFVFWVLDTADLDAATTRLQKEMFHVISDQKWDKPTTGKINTLTATFINGTGKSGDKALDLQVVVLGPTASKKGVVLFAAIDGAKRDAHKTDVKAVFDSVKPAK